MKFRIGYQILTINLKAGYTNAEFGVKNKNSAFVGVVSNKLDEPPNRLSC